VEVTIRLARSYDHEQGVAAQPDGFLLKAAGVVGFTQSVIYSAATADWPR
jgi:hypothetical protein